MILRKKEMANLFYRFALIILLCICISCGQNTTNNPEDKTVQKEIQVEINRNLITSHIIEHMVWEGNYPSRPMVLEAKSKFDKYKNHPAIKLSDSLLLNEIFYFDELTTFLLYTEDLPSIQFKYPLEGTIYEEKRDIIERWLSLISQFYIESDIEGFISENQSFYEGAVQEVKNNLPPKDFVNQLESYYRTQRLSYTLIPSPEMQTGGEYGYRGIGPYITEVNIFRFSYDSFSHI